MKCPNCESVGELGHLKIVKTDNCDIDIKCIDCKCWWKLQDIKYGKMRKEIEK